MYRRLNNKINDHKMKKLRSHDVLSGWRLNPKKKVVKDTVKCNLLSLKAKNTNPAFQILSIQGTTILISFVYLVAFPLTSFFMRN